ncbi:TIGR04282 family arsenosugar biosynthesis glycosyltransferase [Nibrella viscosa]|uniref:TIGR04282 family arsenosugar biosynthesis glycosyltransferase n=1 Tax=Nibrella viscosa TaxID=1084524 RepID=UPI0031EC2445
MRQTASATGLPVFYSEQLITHTGSFGQQLTAAMNAVFQQGVDHLITIGNDCLELSVSHLKQAVSQLQKHPLVLGPDRRGGLYLIGLSRQIFQDAQWLEIPWQTNRVCGMVNRIFSSFSISWLPALADINGIADLYKYQSTDVRALCLVTYLLTLLSGQSGLLITRPIYRRSWTGLRIRSLRAPPATPSSPFHFHYQSTAQ